MHKICRKIIREVLEDIYSPVFNLKSSAVKGIGALNALKDYLIKAYSATHGERPAAIRMNFSSKGSGIPISNPELFEDIIKTIQQNEFLTGKSLENQIESTIYLTVYLGNEKVKLVVTRL